MAEPPTPQVAQVLAVETTRGPAAVHVDDPAGEPRGRLVLGHGAGGGVQAPDLLAVRDVAVAAGWSVLRVEQPWRLAGKRVASPPPTLDDAWTQVLGRVLPPAGPTGPAGPRLPLVLGGRSAGARVACRTAAALGADGVLALAFPLHPPRTPERSRAAELPAGLPLLVVQGERDAFGGPDLVRAVLPPGGWVVAAPGDHSLRRWPGELRDAVAGFLADVAAAARRSD